MFKIQAMILAMGPPGMAAAEASVSSSANAIPTCSALALPLESTIPKKANGKILRALANPIRREPERSFFFEIWSIASAIRVTATDSKFPRSIQKRMG